MKKTKDHIKVKYRAAVPGDAGELTRLFWEHITENTEYISHGEMQMGVALTSDTLSGNGRDKWHSYIGGLLAAGNCRISVVLHGETVVGFGIALTGTDGDKPFGVLNDILVQTDYRNKGIGSTLLAKSVGWLKSQGIENCYLESGRYNHTSHDFFEKHGFLPVSQTFHMNINPQTPE